MVLAKVMVRVVVGENELSERVKLGELKRVLCRAAPLFKVYLRAWGEPLTLRLRRKVNRKFLVLLP